MAAKKANSILDINKGTEKKNRCKFTTVWELWCVHFLDNACLGLCISRTQWSLRKYNEWELKWSKDGTAACLGKYKKDTTFPPLQEKTQGVITERHRIMKLLDKWMQTLSWNAAMTELILKHTKESGFPA